MTSVKADYPHLDHTHNSIVLWFFLALPNYPEILSQSANTFLSNVANRQNNINASKHTTSLVEVKILVNNTVGIDFLHTE